MKHIFIIILIHNLFNQVVVGQSDAGRVNKNFLKTVIKIEIPVPNQVRKPNGTGFIVSVPKKGDTLYRNFYLVTNKHVVGDYTAVEKNISKFFPSLDLFFYSTNRENNSGYIKTQISLVNNGVVSLKIKTHPNPDVDIAIIDITSTIEQLREQIDLNSIDTSYLIEYNQLIRSYEFGVGDQVFAIGYPFGITSLRLNYPIAKSCYISSSTDEEFFLQYPFYNREGISQETSLRGKLFLVDGLIVGGNSGGPVVIPAEQKTRYRDGHLQHRTLPNYVIGIVSSSLGSSGINVIYSAGYIKELIGSL
jgi:S1-C subfamily serine protease